MKRVISGILVCIIFCISVGCSSQTEITNKQKTLAENIYKTALKNPTTSEIGFENILTLNYIYVIKKDNKFIVNYFYSEKAQYKNIEHQQIERTGSGVYRSYRIKRSLKLKKTKKNYGIDKIFDSIKGMTPWYVDVTEDDKMSEIYDLVKNINI